MAAQNQELAAALCKLVGDGTKPGTLTAAQVEVLRSYLVPRSCPDTKDQTTALEPPEPYKAPMSTRLADQAKAWTDLAADTDTTRTDSVFGKSLGQTQTSLAAVGAAITAASKDLTASRKTVGDVNATANEALTELRGLDVELTDLEKKYASAKVELDKALKAAAEGASTANLDAAIDKVSDQGQVSSDQLGDAFDKSAAGLASAAKTLQESGAKAIDQQRADLDRAQQQASRSLSSTTSAALVQVSRDVTSATRDLGSTRTQLTRDLTNVLLDLGNPNVRGSGVIGTVAKGATAAGSADYQLALATDQTSAYAAVREQDVAGIMLRQAQAEASIQAQADLPAFAMDLPDDVQHRTVYAFHLAGGR